MKLVSRLLFCLSLLIVAGPICAQKKYKKRHILKDLKSLPGFENAFIGFKLFDPEKGKIIAEQFADQYMTPASTTKLFTFHAGLRHLPDTLPAMEYVIRGDSLIFWSTGYPLTLHPDHPDSSVVSFLTHTNKNLYYWPRPAKDQRFGPGWGWDDYAGYYGAEKSIFPIYGNSIQFILDNQKQEFQMSPYFKGWQYKVETSNSDRSKVSRDEFWNEYEITFKSLTESDTAVIDTLIRPFRYSNPLFVDLLSQALGKTIRQLDEYQRPSDFMTVDGVRSDSLFKWMLQPSDNLFAEQILLMISGQRSDSMSTTEAIAESMFMNVVSSRPLFQDQFIWKDGSGLSRYNMFKPNELMTLLSHLRKQYGEEYIFELMPQGQTSGTLKDWYGPYVYAKTGTLSNNHSLVGYIKTKDGKTLIFTLMANHYTASTTTIRKSFGTILEKIHKAY